MKPKLTAAIAKNCFLPTNLEVKINGVSPSCKPSPQQINMQQLTVDTRCISIDFEPYVIPTLHQWIKDHMTICLQFV